MHGFRLVTRPAPKSRGTATSGRCCSASEIPESTTAKVATDGIITSLGPMSPLTGDPFLAAAIAEAEQGLREGGIPIGSVLVHDGVIIGRGHNRRVQQGSAVLHGEMDALERAGRRSAAVYRATTLYTTLSPCAMCSGAILLYGIPRVVIGENRTFTGEEDLLRARGVALEVREDPACIRLMTEFIRAHPALWNEDIGV